MKKITLVFYVMLLIFLIATLGLISLWFGDATISMHPFNIAINNMTAFIKYWMFIPVSFLFMHWMYKSGEKDGFKKAQKLISDKAE